MNRAESIMLTYFDDKESYVAFKLAHKVVVKKNIRGLQNSVLTVLDENDNLCSYDGKPNSITVGQTYDDENQNGKSIYCIAWFANGGIFMGGYDRDPTLGPAVIRAIKYHKWNGGEYAVTFSWFKDGKETSVINDKMLEDFAKHLAVHKKATGISYDKFKTWCTREPAES